MSKNDQMNGEILSIFIHISIFLVALLLFFNLYTKQGLCQQKWLKRIDIALFEAYNDGIT